MKKKLLVVLVLILLTIGLFTSFALSADVPMMTKEQLKAILGNSDLLILDIRPGSLMNSKWDYQKMPIRKAPGGLNIPLEPLLPILTNRKMLSIPFRELRKEEGHEEVYINISIGFDFVD
jgi:hypothetical protein